MVDGSVPIQATIHDRMPPESVRLKRLFIEGPRSLHKFNDLF